MTRVQARSLVCAACAPVRPRVRRCERPRRAGAERRSSRTLSACASAPTPELQSDGESIRWPRDARFASTGFRTATRPGLLAAGRGRRAKRRGLVPRARRDLPVDASARLGRSPIDGHVVLARRLRATESASSDSRVPAERQLPRFRSSSRGSAAAAAPAGCSLRAGSNQDPPALPLAAPTRSRACLLASRVGSARSHW